MRTILLKNSLSPGDVVMLTAAVRDLHLCNPNMFQTNVQTSAGALWEHNPHITRLTTRPDVEEIPCAYPLIHRSNRTPHHFIHGFIQDLGGKLGVIIEPTEFKGDIHLSEDERRWMSQVQEITRMPVPFWIVGAGGKFDFTAKWWPGGPLPAGGGSLRGAHPLCAGGGEASPPSGPARCARSAW